ncbi:MrcB family domain-containing protein [Nitrospina gracilis]|uniref:MrcB family domain-containing protein n=1 Tax=Nitrospina gracilis TaxID=35801 RepID=UPI001F468D0B|nr:DUF3578 domain-containing protein [Nitrospina gracilis]MCF8719442.1 5-methylcytosine-specific restriction protein A [Nitrospina gracilis Nb-211]
MNLRECIEEVLNNYLDAKEEPFPKHPLAKFIRKEFPLAIGGLISNTEPYLIKGLAGQGRWSRCPGVVILDTLITETAHKGFYPVYLFKGDMSGVYLSLNQGVTEIREKYKKNPKEVLEIKAKDFRAQIGSNPNTFPEIAIDLTIKNSGDLAAFYEKGNIFAKYYPKNYLPSNEQFEKDLINILKHYEALIQNQAQGEERFQNDDIYIGLEKEDLTKFKFHWGIERPSRLTKKAKKIHGYICQACGFDFKKYYGELGEKYIEAHHLTPISQLKGKIVDRDPRKDFAVLCSNCHRMIHRTENPADLAAFKACIKK